MTMPFLSLPKRRETFADRVKQGAWMDQWGRDFVGSKDNKSGHPAGEILPEGWEPPHVALLPPSKYHVFTKRDNGRFVIDIASWRRDQEGARQEWRKAFGELAKSVYKDKSPEAIKELSSTIAEIVGPMPVASVWMEAMEVGNDWVLGRLTRRGLVPARPAWVDEVIEGTRVTPWETLQRVEFYEGAVGTIAPANRAKYGNPDDDEADEDFTPAFAAPDRDDIVSRFDGQLAHQDLQEGLQPDSQPMRETVRGAGGKFTSKK